MDFGKAFAYVFEDQDWMKKVGIAALVMLIPLVGQIVAGGWALEITRRVIRRDPEPLPDWTEFGDFAIKGLKVFVIGFAYALPIILISVCSQVMLIVGQDSPDDALLMALTGASICLSCVSLLYGIFLGFVLPAALANFAAQEELSAAFRFRDVFGLVRAAPMAYLLVLVGSFAAGLVAMLGVVACVVGLFVTVPYSYAVNAHFWGQAYNEAVAARGSQADFA